jgi:hypothetical protein
LVEDAAQLVLMASGGGVGHARQLAAARDPQPPLERRDQVRRFVPAHEMIGAGRQRGADACVVRLANDDNGQLEVGGARMRHQRQRVGQRVVGDDGVAAFDERGIDFARGVSAAYVDAETTAAERGLEPLDLVAAGCHDEDLKNIYHLRAVQI